LFVLKSPLLVVPHPTATGAVHRSAEIVSLSRLATLLSGPAWHGAALRSIALHGRWQWRKMKEENPMPGVFGKDWEIRPCLLVHSENQKIFKILCHIESFDTCMKH
jgi:hypothetical protein